MKSQTKDNCLKALIYISTAFTIMVLLSIVMFVLIKGLPAINLDFLTNKESGIFPLVVSTFYLVILSLVISIPIGVATAIYLNEYAKPGKLLSIVTFSIQSLAGIPSIIYGLFGMLLFVNTLKMSYSILAGALTLSIMLLPTIIITTKEALKSIPMSYRYGSLALGATKLETNFKIVLPSAISGILVAIVLSISSYFNN